MLAKQKARQCPTQCATEIDYSETTNFPFTIALDLESSILCPAEGQNQRFCYTVTGIGQDLPTLNDISHFLLGICPDITEDQIIADSIEVLIDGVPQEVRFGEGVEDPNVELKTEENPDPNSGCTGLKFDFPVSKVADSAGSVLSFCFELTTPYPVGDNIVCLVSRGDQVANTLSICGPACEGPTPSCTVTAYQLATVCVPVTITPFATHGTVTTVCCGDATITPNAVCTEGQPSCRFAVTQDLCITVPISFGADPDIGDAVVTCIDSSLTNLCADCNGDDNGD